MVYNILTIAMMRRQAGDVTTLEIVLSVVIGEIGEFDVARASRDLESSDAAPSHPGYSRV